MSKPENLSAELDEFIRASNAYRSSVAAARGFVSGIRVNNVRHEEKRLKAALWAARNQLEQLARQA